MDPRRWTPLTFLAPARYVDRDPFWTDFDLHAWADDAYTWVPDPWNGLRDFARRPRATVEAGEGDCEDFALVALSWATANGRSGLGLGFCFEPRTPWPTHAIAFDDVEVYSSGDIEPTTVDGWLAGCDTYARAVRRRVRG
jgi:hypothetical protein